MSNDPRKSPNHLPPESAADAPTPPGGTPSARLRRATSGVTRTVAQERPRPSRPVYPRRRNRAAIVIVAVFCLVFAIALTLFIALSGEPEHVELPDADAPQANDG
ncbi:MAG: hypothetical protein KF696_16220 [Planctomycetes bacterium]|nr:hypothetical protein [Planctomycetota bacterium]MCW8137236.1 hypothetical protein [Planctomycetota bacterium]